MSLKLQRSKVVKGRVKDPVGTEAQFWAPFFDCFFNRIVGRKAMTYLMYPIHPCPAHPFANMVSGIGCKSFLLFFFLHFLERRLEIK